MTRTIYDFGANRGDNLPYYLRKAQRVVAVEANPALCEAMAARFAHETAAGRVVIVNAAASREDSADPVPFHVHRRHDVLGQFPAPPDSRRAEFDTVMVPSRSAGGIVREFGEPAYIKVDVESFDAVVLRDLFDAGIRPPFISAECHHADVFAALVHGGGYGAFKLVDGGSVGERFAQHPVRTAGGMQTHAFPHHSAGPYGEDIPGEWVDADTMLYVLARERLGWKDLHATCTPVPVSTRTPPLARDLTLREVLRAAPRSFTRALRNRLPARRAPGA